MFVFVGVVVACRYREVATDGCCGSDGSATGDRESFATFPSLPQKHKAQGQMLAAEAAPTVGASQQGLEDPVTGIVHAQRRVGALRGGVVAFDIQPQADHAG